jgi:hypothetical protein
MKITKSSLSIWILIFLTLLACSQKIVNNNLWQDKAVITDGVISERQSLRYYNEATKLFYDLSNDDKNFYVFLKTNDQQMQIRILQAGMSVWIDTTGNKKRHVGLLYPLMSVKKVSYSHEKPLRTNFDSVRNDKEHFHKLKEDFLSAENKQLMSIVGFKNFLSGLTFSDNIRSVTAKINWDSLQCMNYEAVIPLKSFYKERLSSDSSKVFSFSVVANANRVPQGIEGPRPGANKSGNNGLEEDGKIPGRVLLDERKDMSEISQENSFRFKFRLAVK